MRYNFILSILLTTLAASKALAQTPDSTYVPLDERDIEIDQVDVVAAPKTQKDNSGLFNRELLSQSELTRAACCNLGESFVNNPSVDVSYSDASTGAKQIKLLGLSGTYVQMLTENIPNYRGAALPYSLGYVPGPWMRSIQVSKGNASVKNGYEAITGQINIEFLKPQAKPQYLDLNAYYSSENKFETNIMGNLPISDRLSTSLMVHYENLSTSHDKNDDGFLDMPKVKQVSVQNRWAYVSPRYIFQASIKALSESRESGQDTHHANMLSSMPIYKAEIAAQRYEAFMKNAYIFNSDHNSNIALILSGNIQKFDNLFGLKPYETNQKNLYASLMYETELSKEHSISVGLSNNLDNYHQDYQLNNYLAETISNDENENVFGGYAQYTYNLDDRLILMAGLRADHSDIYGAFATERMHLCWKPNKIFSLRASAGKGYRTPHALSEYNYLLASGREILIDRNLQQEEAWNYGISSALEFPLGRRKMNVNLEYYYTDFGNQLVADFDENPLKVHLHDLDGESRSHTFQIDASYPVMKKMTLTAAYRLNDVRCTYNGEFLEKPLQSKYKALISLSYKLFMGKWQFDATYQQNGGGRMPKAYITESGQQSWSESFSPYPQLQAQVTKHFRSWDVYIGGENLTNYKQENPIINAHDPWSQGFDSSLIYGPISGVMAYAGVRVRFLERRE